MKFKTYTERTKTPFSDLQILNTFQINDYLTSLFMYSCNCTEDLPVNFKNYFTHNEHVHEHFTRNSKKLHKKFARTNYRKHTLAYKGVDIWNSLNCDLGGTKSYSLFKSRAKKYFIFKYDYSL